MDQLRSPEIAYLADIPTHYLRLYNAATEVLRTRAAKIRHSVSAAMLGRDGEIYVGINIRSSGVSVCAESVALGAAIIKGEKKILAMLAVADRGLGPVILSPCGNCRQIMLDYAPDAEVIFCEGKRVAIATIRTMLPAAYVMPDMIT